MKKDVEIEFTDIKLCRPIMVIPVERLYLKLLNNWLMSILKSTGKYTCKQLFFIPGMSKNDAIVKLCSRTLAS